MKYWDARTDVRPIRFNVYSNTGTAGGRVLEVFEVDYKMNQYQPDEWVIVKMMNMAGDAVYKLFGSWRGGYVSGDEWRLNSGIVKVEKEGSKYFIHGNSGSIYTVHENGYGIRSPYNNSVLAGFKRDLQGMMEIMEEMPDMENLV